MLVTMISVGQFENKLSCPSDHYLSLFLDSIVLKYTYSLRGCARPWFAVLVTSGVVSVVEREGRVEALVAGHGDLLHLWALG